jgi:hypothetical protein
MKMRSSVTSNRAHAPLNQTRYHRDGMYGQGRAAHRIARVLIACVLFWLAYTYDPLYDRNYNTYLLHGLADAGLGALQHDWLAATTDPFPLFSAIVTVIYRFAPPEAFYVAHAALLGVYLFALLHIIAVAHSFDPQGARANVFLGLAIFIHSAAFRAAVSSVTGADWGWYIQSGVAMQYLVGFVFQPSLFGVLLIASLACFLRQHEGWAVALAALATAIHASYFVTSALLIGAYGVVAWHARHAPDVGAEKPPLWGKLGLGMAALVLVFAIDVFRFRPTDAALFARGQAILAHVRIPHHALAAHWIDRSIFLIQLPLVTGALCLAARGTLRVVLWSLALPALALTLLVAASGSDTLALTFPWRTSVVLVPLSSALLLGWVLQAVPPRIAESPLSVGLSIAASAVAAGFGVLQTQKAFKAYARDDALPMMAHVHNTLTPSDLYLIPTDLKRFRLETGARTFVDWKSHPYRDRDVVEWYNRIQAARAVETATGEQLCERMATLAETEHVTHFVFPAWRHLRCPGLTSSYRDARYAIYRGEHWPN